MGGERLLQQPAVGRAQRAGLDHARGGCDHHTGVVVALLVRIGFGDHATPFAFTLSILIDADNMDRSLELTVQCLWELPTNHITFSINFGYR